MLENQIIKFLILPVLAFANPPLPNQRIEDPKVARLKADQGCYVGHDLKACLQNVSPEGTADSDEDYLRFGCDELRGAAACLTLGNFMKKHAHAEDAIKAYDQACALKDADGCLGSIGVYLMNAKNGVADAELKKAVTSAQEVYQKQCGPTPVSAPACKTAQEQITTAMGVNNQHACALATWSILKGNEAPVAKAYDEGTRGPEECTRSCLERSARLKLEPNVNRLRLQCVFNGQNLGAETYRLAAAPANCDMGEKRLGEKDTPYHQTCLCEQQNDDNVNRLATAAGLLAAPGTSTFKRVGAQQWFQCAYRFHPLADKPGADCRKNVAELKAKLAAVRGLAAFDMIFTGVRCP